MPRDGPPDPEFQRLIPMNLNDIINRPPRPLPWAEGDKIPWSEPGFSARMLKEHLSQNHDAASRRFSKIDRHVEWIHHSLLKARPSRILDLGCGPGLYTYRLARLGHICTGIDYSPASIAYAAATVADQDDFEPHNCMYQLEDMRQVQLHSGYDLVMLIFGEFNMFSPADACSILQKTWKALKPGGILLLEPQSETSVRMNGIAAPTWYASKGGLFSDKPHLCLTESFWDEDNQVATRRYYVIDASSGSVARYAETTQAYHPDELRNLLVGAGFSGIETYPSLTGEQDGSQVELYVVTARKA